MERTGAGLKREISLSTVHGGVFGIGWTCESH